MNKEITLEKNQNFHNNQTKERQIQNNPEKHLQPTKHQEYAEPSLRGSNVRSIYSTNNSPQSLINFFKSYNANQEVLNLPKLHSSPNLKLKRYKQSVYYGQFINMKRHGIGIMVYNNQRSYEGDWQCDYKHGKGFQKFPNGCTYQGYYINGKPQGMGRYSWPNGQFYQGQWLNGMKHGSGMWKGAKGDSYVGQWKFGKADGYGAHTWINGDRYQGEFKECLKHGQGLQKFANGDIYKGTYSYGKPSGYGEYYWINGSYFKGVFKNGLRDGQGIWKKGSGNSDKYEGQYLNDKKNGYGIFTWSSGNVYKGNYQADIRNGYGQMYWNDGSFYKGQWKNGIQHGYGQIYVPGQGLKKGVFEENVLIHIEEQTSNYINDGNHFKGRQNVNVSNHQTKIPSKKTSISGKSVQSKIHSNNLNGHQKPTFRSRSRVQSNHKSNNKSVDEAKIIRLSSNYETVNNADLGNKFKRMRIGQSSFDHQSRTINGDELSQNFTRQKILHSASYMHNMLLNNTHAVKLYQKRPANISNLKNQFKRPNQLNNLILYKNQGRKH